MRTAVVPAAQPRMLPTRDRVARIFSSFCIGDLKDGKFLVETVGSKLDPTLYLASGCNTIGTKWARWRGL